MCYVDVVKSTLFKTKENLDGLLYPQPKGGDIEVCGVALIEQSLLVPEEVRFSRLICLLHYCRGITHKEE